MSPIDGRDAQIVQYVARFGQLSSQHIFDLLFAPANSNPSSNTPASRTPCNRALLRLTEQRFLDRIERRIVGGSRGGSGQYVYQLGRRGYYMSHEGKYNPSRTVNYHSLAIADCYVILRQMERAGVIAVVGLSTEPDCHAFVGGVQLKPDMYVDIAKRDGSRLKLWLEVDMGTEAQRQLRGKLENYWRAYNDADVNEWPVFPRVLWVGVDAERAKELRWLIEQGPANAQPLFGVCTRETLPNMFITS